MPLQSFKKLLTSFEFIVCQFFTHCPILNTDLLNYCKAISACVSKCHIFFCNSITLMTNFILLTTCHLLKYFVSNLNLCLSFVTSYQQSATGRPRLGPRLPREFPAFQTPPVQGLFLPGSVLRFGELGRMKSTAVHT